MTWSEHRQIEAMFTSQLEMEKLRQACAHKSRLTWGLIKAGIKLGDRGLWVVMGFIVIVVVVIVVVIV